RGHGRGCQTRASPLLGSPLPCGGRLRRRNARHAVLAPRLYDLTAALVCASVNDQRRCVMRALSTAAIVLLFAGCASTTTTTAQPPGAPQTFSGEVWTWDQPNNVVPLFKDGKIPRVRTTPDQMRPLRLHEQARVTGELAPPADMLVMMNTGPV